MPVLMGFRAKVLNLARQGIGHEDISYKLGCVGVARLHIKHIVLHETATMHRGAKAGPADGEPSLPAGPDTSTKRNPQ